MKKIISLLLIVVLLLSLVGCGSSSSSDGLTKVKVAHHMGYSGAAVVAIGTNMGYFEEEGLDVELVGFTSGVTEIAAMVSGDLQFGYIGSGVTNLAVQGDVEIIAYQNLGDAEAIVTSADSGITSIADLKGKTIATTLGTSGENVVNLALADAGMTQDDVELINMDMGGCVTAILSGQIDAVCIWSSYLVTVKNNLGDDYVELARTSDFADSYASVSSWIATSDYIEANPETTQAFMNALMKCYDYWKDNEEQTAAWVAEIIDSDVADVEAQIGTMTFFNSSEMKEALDDGTIAMYYSVQQQAMLDAGTITEDVDLDTYIQWDLMYQAIENIS